MASLCVCGYPGSPTSNPCSRQDGTDVKGRAMLLGVIVPDCPPSLPRTGNHRRLCPCRGVKLPKVRWVLDAKAEGDHSCENVCKDEGGKCNQAAIDGLKTDDDVKAAFKAALGGYSCKSVNKVPIQPKPTSTGHAPSTDGRTAPPPLQTRAHTHTPRPPHTPRHATPTTHSPKHALGGVAGLRGGQQLRQVGLAVRPQQPLRRGHVLLWLRAQPRAMPPEARLVPMLKTNDERSPFNVRCST